MMPNEDLWSRSILTPSLDSSSSDEDQDDDYERHSRLSYSLCRDAELARELDLTSREDRAVVKQTPFTLAKKQTGKKKFGEDRAGEDLPTRRGNIQPATVNGRKPVEGDKAVMGDRESTVLMERLPYWKGSGWYNNHNQPIIANAPTKRSFPGGTDKLTGARKATRKTKKTLDATAPKGKKGGIGDEDDRPVFRRIRELHFHLKVSSSTRGDRWRS